MTARFEAGRNVKTSRTGRHRKGRSAVAGQAIHPTSTVYDKVVVPIGSHAQQVSSHSLYARHIGRIGALAVALGVGAAMAAGLGAGTARAQDGSNTNDSSQSGDTQSDSPSSTPGSTENDPTPPPGSNDSASDPTDSDTSGGEMQVGSSGGQDSSVNDGGQSTDTDPADESDSNESASNDGGSANTPGDELPDVGGTATQSNTAESGGTDASGSGDGASADTSARSAGDNSNADDQFDAANFAGTQSFSLMSANDLTPTAATAQTLADWGLPLPQYPDVPGFTKTEVAGVAFIVLARATISSLATNPLVAIPLALMTLTAFGRLVQYGENEAPTATYQQTEQVLGVVNGQVFGDDPEGDPITYSISLSQQGANGFAVIDPETGKYTYTAYTLGVTPVEDTFYVTVADNMGIRGFTSGPYANSTVIPISINIPGITANQHPVFDVEATVTNTDTATGVVTGIFKAHDPEGTALSYGGLAVIGSVDIADTANADGTYAFTYTPYDAHAAAVIGATTGVSDVVVITATDADGIPWASSVPINLATSVNQGPLGGLPSNVLGDSDGVVRGNIISVVNPDNDPLTYSLAGGNSTAYTDNGGIVHVDSAGNYTYIPKVNTVTVLGVTSNLPYLDSFDVVVDDGHGGTATVTVPVLTCLAISTSTTSPESGTVDGQVNFDKAENAGLFTFGPDAGSAPTKGEVTVNPDGTFHYVATTAGPGDADTFGIVGTAYGLSLKVASLTVTPIAPKHAPTADAVAVGVGDSIGIAQGNVHASDEDGDTLTYSVTGYDGASSAVLSNGAVVQVDADGNWAYIPPTTGGVLGVILDGFTVYVSDGNGGQTSTAVGITTKPLDISYTSNVNGGTVSGALNIPQDDVHLLTFKEGSGGLKGTWTVEPDGSYSYTTSLTGHTTPATDSFTVVGTTTDGHEITVATVNVSPALPNTPPSTTATLTNVEVSYVELLGNTSAGTQTVKGKIVVEDAEGDPLTFSAGTLGAFTGSRGAGVVNSDGTFTYTTYPGVTHAAAAGGPTSDTFTVKVADGFGGTADVQVTVTIDGRNAKPSIPSGVAPLTKFKTATWTFVIPTDADLESLSWTYTANTGSVAWNLTTGVLTYTSNGGGTFQKGPSDTIVVTVNDGHGGIASRTFNY